MTTRVVVVRHGQTYGNIDGLFCGHSETELTPLGIAQARAAGRRLADVAFDAAYASDLSRASRTADYVLEGRMGLKPSLDPDLREMHYGEWEARPGHEIGKETPDLLRDFFQARLHAAPGGETLRQVRERTAASVRRVVEAHKGGTVLVVSHGNAIMAMLAEFLQLPIEGTWSFAVDNTSITRMEFSKSGRFTLSGFNDAAHTHGLAEATA
jgi:broad specificity phosphatase PhoE